MCQICGGEEEDRFDAMVSSTKASSERGTEKGVGSAT
jgi:hypothetical protein